MHVVLISPSRGVIWIWFIMNGIREYWLDYPLEEDNVAVLTMGCTSVERDGRDRNQLTGFFKKNPQELVC